MTEVEVKEAFRYKGSKYEPGDTVDLPDGAAEDAIGKGYAEKKTDGENIPKLGQEENEIDGEEAEGIDVSGAKARGGWLTAGDVEKGDEILIMGTGRWDDTFADDDRDKDLVVPVEHKGEEYEWRVNKTNLGRIADAFGNNTADWIGETVVVDEVVKYPQLGTRGFYVEPVV